MNKTLKVGFVAILLILSATTINAQKFNAKDIVITGQAWGGMDMEIIRLYDIRGKHRFADQP